MAWLCIAAILLAACTETSREAVTHEPGGHGQVVLIRGLANVFSTGLDSLASELKKEGIEARPVSLSNSAARATTIARAYRASPANRPVILVGHSFGADQALEISRDLEKRGVPVALIVTFDPTSKGPVPANVRRAVNMYTGGKEIWAPVAPAPGFRGQLVNMDVKNGSDAVAGVNHFNVEKAERLHKIAIREIKSALRR